MEHPNSKNVINKEIENNNTSNAIDITTNNAENNSDYNLDIENRLFSKNKIIVCPDCGKGFTVKVCIEFPKGFNTNLKIINDY